MEPSSKDHKFTIHGEEQSSGMDGDIGPRSDNVERLAGGLKRLYKNHLHHRGGCYATEPLCH